MDSFALVAVLLVGVVVFTSLSERIRIPQPVLLTIFGLCLGLLHLRP